MRKKKTTTKTAETVMTPVAADVKEAAAKTEKTAEKETVVKEAVKEETMKEVNEKETSAKEESMKKDNEKKKSVEKASKKEAVISDMTLEIFETSVSAAAIEKAVKADAIANELYGEIRMYINAAERAVYYTVDNDPEKGNKIELSDIAE